MLLMKHLDKPSSGQSTVVPTMYKCFRRSTRGQGQPGCVLSPIEWTEELMCCGEDLEPEMEHSH